MPMLALLLLLTGLFGRDADAGEDALRGQILRDQAQGSPAPHLPGAGGVSSVQLYRLRQDRILQLGQPPLPQAPADGRAQQETAVRIAQLWERVDGQWQLQRVIRIAPAVTRR